MNSVCIKLSTCCKVSEIPGIVLIKYVRLFLNQLTKQLYAACGSLFAISLRIFSSSIHSLIFPPHIPAQPFKRQPPKMVKHNQTSRRQVADELFECV